MAKPWGTPLTSCPSCQQAIGDEHPYQWCAECGNPLPNDVLQQISNSARLKRDIELEPIKAVASRPLGVWIVTVFIYISVFWLIFSYIAIFSSSTAVGEIYQSLFLSVPVWDHMLGLLQLALNILGAHHLFKLSRHASTFFIGSVVTSILSTVIYSILDTVEGTATSPEPGYIGGQIIGLIIVFYTLNLRSKGIIK